MGQHYLVDSAIIKRILELAAIQRDKNVLEIGTGKGALTSEISRYSNKFEAYEIDEENYLLTKERVKGFPWVKLHLADAFESRTNFDILISSLPYSKSSTFIEWLSTRRYERCVVVLQEDFVTKLLAPPGKGSRAISAIAQISSRLEVMGQVNRSSFEPEPRVNSVIVLIRPRRRLNPATLSLIKRLFSLKRRKLSFAVKKLALQADYSSVAEMDERIQSIQPDRLYQIVERISSNSNSLYQKS